MPNCCFGFGCAADYTAAFEVLEGYLYAYILSTVELQNAKPAKVRFGIK